MEEIWKDIYFIQDDEVFDYREKYQVSNYGRVKRNGKEKNLKNIKDKDGYLRVNLCKNGKGKQFSIHRLVAHMFIDGYFDGAEVNHIDENKENNHVENLEWCDREYNNNYGTRGKRASESSKGKTRTDEFKKRMSEKLKDNKNAKGFLVVRYDLEMNLIDIKYIYEYKQMGFNQGNISSCCMGKRKTCQGYIFKYHEEV